MARPLTGLLTGLLTLALGACSLAPTYVRPTLGQDAAQYKEAGEWAPAAPADEQPRADWWQAFGDAQLDALESRLRTGNPDLRAGVARFDEARAIAGEARSRFYPQLNLDASGVRGRASSNGPNALAAGKTGDDFVTSLDMAWEIDLFGRLRNTAAAARARAQGSAADLAALELSLQAELATDYFTLRGDDSTVKLLEDSVAQFDTAWQQTRRRYDTGVAAATDVDQADALRQSARAQLAATRLQRSRLEHAIAVLLGSTPAAFSLEPAPLAAEPPAIRVALPSVLLERRPDVASAERALAAANAGIGIARAAWFPVFSLQAAAAGFESTATAGWIGAPSRFWSVGPGGQLPLLDAGGRSALNRQARAAYEEALAGYRKVALTAYQEVEDSLVAVHRLGEEQAADAAAATSAQSAAFHADERYAAGVADYVEVTTTHTAALSARSAALAAQAARLNAAVALVRALGGGWSAGPTGSSSS
ncbi:MAG TPA: efflux transporter outer membrane subunit [Steroidobacteraceae bacterium]|nr:efflux transporter outer membrane subunit [Steroidobacteraceae bacterium]